MRNEITIVGAGIIGMSLALVFSSRNKKVTILERNLKKSLSTNRIYSISSKSKSLFEEINVWGNLKELNKEISIILKKDGINIYTVRNQTDGDFKKGVHRGEDMYEMNGFIVHYFSENKVKKLLDGFINLNIENFNEGNFPRKLFLVINKKK